MFHTKVQYDCHFNTSPSRVNLLVLGVSCLEKKFFGDSILVLAYQKANRHIKGLCMPKVSFCTQNFWNAPRRTCNTPEFP